ncbi:MAG TPA: DUF2252 domain-containing protein [Candidatus Angelobacter sp.]|nr:DUF2252 domain-containing protein [Candidatus Angelobacter sp.]
MNAKPMTRKQSIEYGRAQRKRLSRSDLGTFDAKARRIDAIGVIHDSCDGRLAELIPVKFKLMAASMFAFYRGTVEVMAADLASSTHTQIYAQLCGDAHVKNFGFFATPDAHVVFDVNDFDETWPGPWEWDVKRLIASIVVGGREAGESNRECKEIVEGFLAEYCHWIHTFSDMTTIEVARHRARRDLNRPAIAEALEKAQRATPLQTLKKLAKKTPSGWKFRSVPNVLWEVPGKTKKLVLDALKQYRDTLSSDHQLIFDRFHPVDVAFKLVGTGSVGTRDYVVLFFGRDENDPLFLQVKEEPPAIYARYINHPQPQNEGRRVVEGQRALQVQSDLMLGWCTIEERDYLVRQLNDHKSSLEIEDLKGSRLMEYSRLCAELLAKGHARSGDPVAIASYLGPSGKSAESLMRFASTYAEQVEADYDAFRKALKNGTLPRKAGTTLSKKSE